MPNITTNHAITYTNNVTFQQEIMLIYDEPLLSVQPRYSEGVE